MPQFDPKRDELEAAIQKTDQPVRR